MTHEEAIDRLEAFGAGSLPVDERRDLEAHLAVCDDCRSVAGAVRLLCQVVSETGDDPQHPYTEEIVAAVLDPESLPQEDRAWIERHVITCPACSEEGARIVAVEKRVMGETPVSRHVRWGRQGYWAVAATVLLALLVYPVYLGLVRLPQADKRVEDLSGAIARLEASRDAAIQQRNELRDWSGAVDLHLVESVLRGESGPVTIPVSPDRPFTVLGVDVRIPGDLPGEETLRIRISDPSNRDVLVIDLPVSAARRQKRETGVITVVVSSAALEPGPYELRVLLPGRADVPDLLEVPLRIVP